MPLPASWADELFARLTLRYGSAFLRQWADADPAAVKADWAAVLDNMPADAIAYALRYLPPSLPLNAMQFRDICRRAPPPPAPRLEAPRATPEEAARALQAATAALQRRPGLSHAKQCAENIKRIAAARGYMSAAQRHQLAVCERTDA